MSAPEYVTIEFKIRTDVLEQVTAILAKEGLTVEDALILFFKATIACGDLPFLYTQEDIEAARKAVEELEKDDLCIV